MAPPADPSSSSTSTREYEVFLNFRGEDTRNNFISKLYSALQESGVRAFLDEEKVHIGEKIGPKLLTAIEQSRISIVVFSKNYGSSKWCLQELVKILQCYKSDHQIIIPIFIDVEPTDVKNQTGSFETAFGKHENNFKPEIVGEWRKALREVGELKGWVLDDVEGRDESKLVQLVVGKVLNDVEHHINPTKLVSVVDVAILSCILRRVYDKLASPIFNDFRFIYIDNEDVEKLRRALLTMEAVLNEADPKQEKNTLVKEWLSDFNDLAYDAEDLLDQCATQVGQWNQVRNSSHACSSSCSTNVEKINAPVIEPGLKNIIKKSEDLAKQIGELQLKPNVEGRKTHEIEGIKRETSSFIESKVFGREGDKEEIVGLLLSDGPSGGDVVEVLPIVGMGGLGKTTLAKLVYNDESVVGHFDLKAWVCISEEINVGTITKDILEAVTKVGCDVLKLDLLQGRLIDMLKGKKFLIVLDDIWNENAGDWETLRIPFRYGKQGSKVIVTTRSTVVSKIMGTISPHSLKFLTNEDCSSLFWQCANKDNKYVSTHPNLKEIGEEIVRKCKGLPLAARTLGSLLRFKDDEEWKDILTTCIWDIQEDGNNIMSILRLSYQHLPSHLKQCFVYCSIFPKDYKFYKEELVWMWMAEGFVCPSGRKEIEYIGSSYFDGLCSRSFFQYSCDDLVYETPMFIMHDLLHDLAQSISKDICVSLDDDKLDNIDKAHYSSLVNVRDQPVEFNAFYYARRLRTFLLFPPDEVIKKSLPDLFLAWRSLRVLSLRNVEISKLPDSIDNLKLLRYLDLMGTKVKTLPESVCNLYNLQTLILDAMKLPKHLCNLRNLRHFIKKISLPYFKKMPCGIEKLTNLQTLSEFVVDNSNESARLGELKDLIHLSGELRIFGLHKMVDVMDAKEANLANKHLCKLQLDWTFDFGMDSEEKRGEVEEMLEYLQPHNNLKELRISLYPGIRFPTWIERLTALVKLDFYSCKGIQVLPPLGQLPLLKSLSIANLFDVERVGGSEFYGDGLINGFPSLEKLEFENMYKWEEWSTRVEEGQEEEEGGELFPHLLSLHINCCSRLTRLPFYRLPSLVDLTINKCNELTTLSRLRIPSLGGDGGEFPCLRYLEINTCCKLRQLPRHLPSLVNLQMNSCQELDALPRVPLLRNLDLQKCNWKTIFTTVDPLPSLSNVPRPKCPTEHFLQPLTALEKLSIYDCKNTEALGSEVVRLHHLVSLREVKINGYGKLVLSFPKEAKGFPFNLQCLDISPLKKLKCLPKLHNLTSLVELRIRMAPKLASFPETGMPPKLRKLEIVECIRLESMPKGMNNLTCLEALKINTCPRFTSLGVFEDKGGLFPPSLEKLCIKSCKNLKELSRHELIHHNFTSPGASMIKGCRTIALKEIRIEKCKNLESLPAQMQKLTSLEDLCIVKCPRLVTFPGGGLPTNKLQMLEISGCGDHLDTLPKCVRLHRLTSLKNLTISRCFGFVSFPREDEQEWKLPPNLGMLSFKCFNSLKLFRSNWLHNLTSLETLEISHAPKLTTLPEEGPPTTLRTLFFRHLESLEFLRPSWLHKLTSLEVLVISKVPKVASLPEEGLPMSLHHLRIIYCPHLKELCQKEGGKYWPKIAHIPNVIIF